MGHNYMGHNYMGHYYMGHNYVGRWQNTQGVSSPIGYRRLICGSHLRASGRGAEHALGLSIGRQHALGLGMGRQHALGLGMGRQHAPEKRIFHARGTQTSVAEHGAPQQEKCDCCGRPQDWWTQLWNVPHRHAHRRPRRHTDRHVH